MEVSSHALDGSALQVVLSTWLFATLAKILDFHDGKMFGRRETFFTDVALFRGRLQSWLLSNSGDHYGRLLTNTQTVALRYL